MEAELGSIRSPMLVSEQEFSRLFNEDYSQYLNQRMIQANVRLLGVFKELGLEDDIHVFRLYDLVFELMDIFKQKREDSRAKDLTTDFLKIEVSRVLNCLDHLVDDEVTVSTKFRPYFLA